jgi:hypothetical protein
MLGLVLAGCPSTNVVVGGSSVGESGDTSDPAGSDTTATDTNTGETGDGDGDVVQDHRTYFIGESTKFDGGGLCDNSGLNAVTSTLRNELVDAGWTGLRFVNDNSWPEDFREATMSDLALDEIHGDAARLSIYAGHGNVGMLQWGRPSDNGVCRTNIDPNARLGTLAGDTAGATMLMTSCTMRADQLWPVFQNQACRQFLGYHDSPFIGHDEARKVFKRTQDSQPTADAWLEEMEANIGSNSPVVFTMGTSPDDATSTHGITNLASGEGMIMNVGEPADNFQFELWDNGCTKICGNCNGNAPPLPEIMFGALVPRVTLTRPLRSADDLVAHAALLIARFDVGPLDQAQQARLEVWASSVVERGEISYAQILDEPRLDLSYDPSSDLLRITNRDALARARPGPGSIVDDPPGLEATLRLEAEAVRAELQTIPGALDLLGSVFEVTTRELGYGSADMQTGPIAFEYMFTLPGQFEGLALPDRRLGIGVTRLGELSTLVVSVVDVQVTGTVGFQRTPQEAIDVLEAEVLAQYQSALDIEIVVPRVGYQLAEGQLSTEALPSLLVGYVLAFGPEANPVVSRRVPVRISLSEPDAPIESLAAVDPNPQAGDQRAAN